MVDQRRDTHHGEQQRRCVLPVGAHVSPDNAWGLPLATTAMAAAREPKMTRNIIARTLATPRRFEFKIRVDRN